MQPPSPYGTFPFYRRLEICFGAAPPRPHEGGVHATLMYVFCLHETPQE